MCCACRLQDPPKDSAREAVRELQDSGVHLKVLTGDSVAVARKVCAQVGIPAEHTITGQAESGAQLGWQRAFGWQWLASQAAAGTYALQHHQTFSRAALPLAATRDDACLLSACLQGQSCRSWGQPSFARQCARPQCWAG